MRLTRFFAAVGGFLAAVITADIPAKLYADDVALSSPDGRILITVDDQDASPHYRVSRDGKPVIGASKLGMIFRDGLHLEEGFEIARVSRTSKDETWQQPWGEARHIRDHHNAMVVHFRHQQDGRVFQMEFRAFDSGIGFRYLIPAEGERVILDELTQFVIDPTAESWWIPAGGAQRYEYLYHTSPVAKIDRAHTPMTVRLADGTHMAFHEAALINYGGAWLDQRRKGVFEINIAPRFDGSKVLAKGDITTPWRTVQIADSAAGLVNGATMTLNLNAPNALGDISYVKPQKYAGIWWGMHKKQLTWGSGTKHGATTERTKAYIDFAAANGFGSVLVEGWNIGWDGNWISNGDVFSFTKSYDDFDLKDVTDYAREKDVRLVGHHETSGNITNYEKQLDAALDLYQAHGVRAIKTGYVADGGDLKYIDGQGLVRYTWHDAQESVDHHIRVLEKAHDHQMMINAHEPVKDTGLRRTYPNWVSREGARGMEFNAWGSPPNPPEHTAILPFTRLLSGPMDFTPGVFDLFPRGTLTENRVNTTLAKQLALYVVIHSPLQMVPDTPENYAKYPAAFQFIKDVATDWENSIALDGDVGDFIVMARQARGSANWFVGALTDENARWVRIPLQFLNPGQGYKAKIYRDGARADYQHQPYDIMVESMIVSADQTLRFRLGRSGGLAISFAPVME